MPAIHVGRSRGLAFRLRVQHLHRRLPAGSFAAAAGGGLQDSAPRSGVLSLHARMCDVEPNSWDDPTLVQIWGPRGAVYIIPAEAFPAFTRGRLPRDPEARGRLQAIGQAAAALLEEGPRFPGEVAAEIRGLQRDVALRPAAVVGTFRIRWDARLTTMSAMPMPEVAVDEARVELARRFMRWFAPTTVEAFAAWAGLHPFEARETWAHLEPELVPVSLEGSSSRWVHAEDEAALRSPEPVRGVRLLPPDDPYMKLDRDLLVPDPELRRRLFPVPGKGSPPYLPGGLLVDGELVGTWARQGRRFNFYPWGPLTDAVRAATESEARTVPIEPRSQAVRIQWHDTE